MVLISMADEEYRKRLLFSMKRAESYGYNIIPYDVGGLGFGRQYNIPEEFSNLSLPPKAKVCLTKPLIIRDAINLTDEAMVYLDADAFVTGSLDGINTNDYDVGVTYKPGHSRVYINAGVLFLKQTDMARHFLNMWIARIVDVEDRMKEVERNQIGDQIFLNDLVFSYVRRGSRLLNTIQDVDGVRVKFFDYREYNHFSLFRHNKPTKPIPETTKIVHLRQTTEPRFREVIAAWDMSL